VSAFICFVKDRSWGVGCRELVPGVLPWGGGMCLSATFLIVLLNMMSHASSARLYGLRLLVLSRRYWRDCRYFPAASTISLLYASWTVSCLSLCTL